MSNNQRREYFRVPVPEAELITFETGEHHYRVLEISENGIRLASDQEHEPESWIRGTISYDLDRKLPVVCQVLRCESNDDGTYTSVARVFNLSMAEVVAFQTYFVRRYGRGGLAPDEAAPDEAASSQAE